MPVRSESFWVGNLAMTAALALKQPDPRPLLRSAVREYMQANPHSPLTQELRATLKERN